MPKPRWLPILMYHRIVDDISGPDPYNLCVSTAEFETQMRYLKDRGYRSITLEELALMTIRGDPPLGKPVIITFDDGYKDVFDHAFPILQRHQLTATHFIVSSCIGGVNVWDRGRVEVTPLMGLEELKEMRKHGMDFGSHSATHRPLTGLGLEDAKKEILDSKTALEEGLEIDVLSFCFPHSRSDPDLEHAVRQAGYLAACGGERRAHRLFKLSRIDVARCRGNRFLWWLKVSGIHYRLRRSRALRSLKAFLPRSKVVNHSDVELVR